MEEKEQLLEKRRWKRDDEYLPRRQIILWGYDKEGNPGFLILYGIHKVGNITSNKLYLTEEVTYEAYHILTGKNGHLPSLPEKKLREDFHSGQLKLLSNSEWQNRYLYYYQSEEEKKKRYKESTLYIIKQEKKRPKIPYYEELSYEECINRVLAYQNDFEGFQIVKNPEEILQFGQAYASYFHTICELMAYPNRYIRKKRLKELLQASLPIKFYQRLIQIGSTELLSGLFLELAKQKNPFLLDEANELLQTADFDEPNYINGLKRCIFIYTTSLDEKEKENQEQLIRKELPLMDLHLLHVDKKEFPAGTIIEGAAYRKYALQGLLVKYYYEYGYNNGWKSVKKEYPAHYKKSKYCDGYYLNILEVKHTIQQAEIYDLPDIIGTIAYYMDAPRLTYYFIGNSQTKAHRYFKRYLKRIIDEYAKKSPDKFIQVMKALFCSYKKEDYVCKFKGNFQFNKFIKQYLYYDYKEDPSTSQYTTPWYIRQEKLQNDQLLRLQGRYEFHKEIWDSHLADVAEILLETEVEIIQKACYFILKEAKPEQIKLQLSEEAIVKLSICSYPPARQLFQLLLQEKLKDTSTISSTLLLALIKSGEDTLCQFVKEYIKEKGAPIESDFYVELFLLESEQDWFSIWREQLNQSSVKFYFDFVQSLIKRKEEISSRILSDSVKNELHASTNWFAQKEEEEKKQYWSSLIELVFYHSSYPEVIEEFLEELIFSFSGESLLALPLSLEENRWVKTDRNYRSYFLIKAIKQQQIPDDSFLINILEKGSQKMLQALFQLVLLQTKTLLQRKSTLLLFAESDITRWNELVRELLEPLPPEQAGEYYAILLDSPIEKAYQLGLYYLKKEYQAFIPVSWLLPLMEHPANEVRQFITTYLHHFIAELGGGNMTLFLYYTKTILYLPNKLTKAKQQLYQVLPAFVKKYPDSFKEIEPILLDIAGSNVKTDSEKALVTIAKIRNEVLSSEG